MIAIVAFLQCVWHSPTQHCTNKKHCSIYACTFNYNVTCQFLFALCGLEGLVNKHSWQWQRDIYVLLSFAERALLSGVSKEKTSCIHWVMHHPIPVSKLQAWYILLQTYLSYSFQGCVNISVCPYFPGLNILARFE